MTHSSHSRRKDVIEARNFEVALNGLIYEQRERAALAALGSNVDVMKAELSICTALEQFRRNMLEGQPDTSSSAFLIRSLVRDRIPQCRPHDFEPGEYCADCGDYRADGDEF